MKEYPIILDDEELEDLMCVLATVANQRTLPVSAGVASGVLKQLESLKAQNEEDYGS
jgi:hypothetical protein